MTVKSVLWLGLSTLALALSSCVSTESGEKGDGSPPFIDPLVVSQNLCRGKGQGLKPTPTDSNIDTADFTFSAPYALPENVAAHFHFPITTSEPDAQLWFDTGLSHMANFNHDEAIAAFRKAQTSDPDCAMCYWGEGLSFGSNINAPFNKKRGAAGLKASMTASQNLDGANAKERALIEALSTRYAIVEDGSVIEEAQIYADAMDEAARRFSEDKFILSLAAEANMNTQPWNYWASGGLTPVGRTARTIEILESALALDPDFAPAIHLYIHATEASIDPFRAEDFADRLASQSLGIGHLVHMPSHIYFRLGKWRKSQAANLAAIADDERYIAQAQNSKFYAAGYYPHNVHFVVANAQLSGSRDTAIEMSQKLQKTVNLKPERSSPYGEHKAVAPIFTALQFSDYDAVLAMDTPPEPHLFLRAVRHFSRGSVFAARNENEKAALELKALQALPEATGLNRYEQAGVPLTKVIEIASLTLAGRINAAQGDLDGAISQLEQAAIAHDALSYMEPGWWYYPTRQTLAAHLLRDGQAERAEREFYRTLIASPNNAYALYGLAEAYKFQGDIRSEDYARYLFRKAWMGEPNEMPELRKL